MSEFDHPTRVLRRYLDDPACGWSIGALGAIAEFHWQAGEGPPDGLTLATGRGAIRVVPPKGARPIAYERLSKHPGRWIQGAAICLPAAAAAMNGRGVLTEIGPDEDAIREGDRDAVLFDLGLGIAHVDACVRTDDSELMAQLRSSLGRSILEPESAAMAAILAHGPHRVFRSRLGRVEVYGPIPPPDGVTEEGPHTHLLPDLLASGRSHAAGTPVPRGHLPCLDLYPANPLVDKLGRPQVFKEASFAAFEALLAAWGDEGYVAEKARARAAVRGGMEPGVYDPPKDRLGRAALRIALRQLAHTDGESASLAAWCAAFDAGAARASRRKSTFPSTRSR